MKAIISIIVPIYKTEKELPRCVESILAQSYPDLEIILVNDGSPDHCIDICKEYAAKDRRILVLDKKNGGLSDARNAGLRIASGKYIMYVDSDDYIEPRACEMLLSGMKNEEVDFVVGAIREIRSDEVLYQRHKNIVPGKIYCKEKFLIDSISANEWYAPACMNLYKKNFLIKHDLYFEVDRYYEDMEMLPRLYLSANKVVYVDFPFYNYVIRNNSIITSSIDEKKTKDIIKIYSEWKTTFDQVNNYELKRYLYGALIKCYLKSCRTHKIQGWVIPGMGLSFSLKYALNLKEFIKIAFFGTLPQIYIRKN